MASRSFSRHAGRRLIFAGFVASLLALQHHAATARGENQDPSPKFASDEANAETSLAQTAPNPSTPVRPGAARGSLPSAPSPTTAPRSTSPPAAAWADSEPPLQPELNPFTSWLGAASQPRGIERLAGTPNMFGDLFNNLGGSVRVVDSAGDTALGDLPLAAGSRRVKIAENDKALPEDRVFVLYNHFNHALDYASELGSLPVRRSLDVDRYTFGFEKTLFCGCWSVEMRMPLAGESQFATSEFGVSGGNVGNLAVILKRLIYRSDTTAVAIGLGMDTPTGSDVDGMAVDAEGATSYTVRNDAVHVMPYIGFLRAPDSRFFYQGFLQCDIPTNGNRIDYRDVVGSGNLGILNEQALLYVDLSAGYWLHRNPCACITGLAVVSELHYTTTLEDSDQVLKIGYPAPRLFFGNFANRVDVVNLTVGLHAELANQTVCRVGGAFPLSSGDNRAFDSELQVQLERRF